MPLKKQERKEEYSSVIGLMLQGKNKEAFNKLACMCGKDTGLFIMADYDKEIAKLDDSVCFANKGDSEANIEADIEHKEVLQTLENAANFMRGMAMDISLSVVQREALTQRAYDIDSVAEKHV